MPDFLIGLLCGIAGVVVGVVAVLSFRGPGWRPGTPQRQETGQNTTSEELSTLLAAIPQAHIITDQAGSVARASTLAYSIGLVRGHRITRFEIVHLVEKALATGDMCEDTLTMRRSTLANTGTITLNLRVTPLGDGRVLILFADNTSARRVEDMRRDFVANVSHELKTPIGAIGLLAETVEDCADEPDVVRKFSGQLQLEARRLADLVQEIIQLSRLQDGDAMTNPELLDVHAIIAEAADRVRIEAKNRSIALRVGKPRPGHELYVYGDHSLLTTAIRNLLDNAIRYSNPQSAVSIGVAADAGFVRIAVVDQGAGIPADMRERVFERFFRGDYARSRETGGSGLGLSIVKHVANTHGGRVELWSDEGRGSTFTLVIPAAEAGDSVPSSKAAEPGETGSSPESQEHREEVHS